MKRLLLGLLGVFCSGAVIANGGVDAVRKQVQASMLVTGSIVVAQDGSVNSYTLDQQDKLPPLVLEVINKTVPHWRFGIDVSDFQEYMRASQARLLKAKMNLRVVAVPVDNQNYSVSISEASFGEDASARKSSSDTLSEKDIVQPRYPSRSSQDGVGGTVYVYVRIGRDGKVEDQVARQVNLHVVAPETEMAVFRKDLAKAAVDAVRRWTFNPPTSGKEASWQHWYAMVPVEFCQSARCDEEAYGKWAGYIPGPNVPIPWHDDPEVTPQDSDAMPSGVAFQPDQRLKLLTSLGKS
ncbi:energy transducer TonB [Dyella sp. S184]|uniref:energy transducer TonB n=1 Tax=Dyella sp. S184 TaxID=1641862 RepID=UPI00131D1449|nr:energy transducer TonB [Dyella sp. S184]